MRKDATIFKNYEYFMNIAAARNITAAAKASFITQPSMTGYLLKLEDSLGVTLFDRSSKPLRFTRAGETFYEYVIKYDALLKSLEADLATDNSNISGQLTIGIPLQFQQYFTRKFIVPFADAFPSISVSLSGPPSLTLEELTMKRLLDVSLIHICKGKVSENLNYINLRDDPILLICNKNHRLVQGKRSSPSSPVVVSVADVINERFYMFEPSFLIRRVPDTVFASIGRYPKRVLQIQSISTVIRLCEGGDSDSGFGFIPQSLYHIYEANSDQLAVLKFKEDPMMLEFMLCWSKGSPSPQAKVFIDFVKQKSEEKHLFSEWF